MNSAPPHAPSFSLEAPPLVWLEERHAARVRRRRAVAAILAAIGSVPAIVVAWAHLA